MKSPTKFIESAKALLALDANGALIPHGIGGHARSLLEDAIELLSRHEPTQTTAESLIEAATARADTPSFAMPHYQLLWSTDPKVLSERVNEYMQKGYVLVGAPVVTDETDTRCSRFTQAVCRPPVRAERDASAVAKASLNEVRALIHYLNEGLNPQHSFASGPAREGARV